MNSEPLQVLDDCGKKSWRLLDGCWIPLLFLCLAITAAAVALRSTCTVLGLSDGHKKERVTFFNNWIQRLHESHWDTHGNEGQLRLRGKSRQTLYNDAINNNVHQPLETGYYMHTNLCTK